MPQRRERAPAAGTARLVWGPSWRKDTSYSQLWQEKVNLEAGVVAVSAVRLEFLTQGSPHIDCVRRMLLEHSRTLGFFPLGALKQYVERGHVLVAVDGSECAGFITFRPRQDAISIVHLCVAETHRGSGVARKLADTLSAEMRHYVGIGLKCRADYGLDDFWRKLGFVPGKKTPGRGRDRAPLVFYWRDHGHPGLFDAVPSPRIRAVLDANVVLDILESRDEESQALVADWLADEVEYLFAPQLLEDLKGQRSESELAAELGQGDWLRPLQPQPNLILVEDKVQSLRSLLGSKNQPSWELDLRQIASAIVSGCPFFVTRDRELIRGSAEVRDLFGIRVLRPAELILHIDELIDRAKYRADRLSGTPLVCRKVGAGQAERLASSFAVTGRETKSSFDKRLYAWLASPAVHEVIAVSSGEEACGLVIYARNHPGRLEVPLLRVGQSGDPYIVAAHMLAGAVERAAGEGHFVVTVTDPHVQPELLSALTDLEFGFRDAAWIHYTVARVGPSLQIRDELLATAGRYPEHREVCEELADSVNLACGAERPNAALRIEKALWPLKLTDAPIPSYIVPIEAKWAAELFDSGLAAQTLFGANANLMLRPQNVYYRRDRPRVIEGPGRVLWYVSRDRDYGGPTMALRACSYIDRVDFGDADSCYERYRHLGVFTRQDVRVLADGRPVMAFTFSHTELFPHPVPYETVRAILRDAQGSAPTFQSPFRLTAVSFARLYWQGKYGSLEGSRVEESPAPVHSPKVH